MITAYDEWQSHIAEHMLLKFSVTNLISFFMFKTSEIQIGNSQFLFKTNLACSLGE